MTWDKPKFEIGEVVKLRSSTKSASSMTIENMSGSKVSCVWMDKAQVRRDAFPKDCLKLSSDADAHIIFMPEDMLNDEGREAFLSGEYVPGGRH